LRDLVGHPWTTRGDPVQSAVTPAIAETQDVKGLPPLPMARRSAVWMGSGTCSVCHVIISTDQGLGTSYPIPIHHNQVPAPGQSRGDVTGHWWPVTSGIQSAFRRGASGPFQLTLAMGYVPAFLIGTNDTVRSAHSRGSCRGRGVVEAVSRGPFTSPKPSRPARRLPSDANVCRTRPVERCVSELSLYETKVVAKWAILGR
jgi:hypothetical protein